LLLTDVWRYERFMVQHPPMDMLYAIRHGFKAPESKPKSLKEAARANRAAMSALPARMQLNPSRLPKLPEHLKSPELLGIIDEMREAWA
jgi:hypothetical protein